jgi:hypothetical protein
MTGTPPPLYEQAVSVPKPSLSTTTASRISLLALPYKEWVKL